MIGWTLKAASTLIVKSARMERKCGIAEARQHVDGGGKCVLVVRHPLDRQVSNYRFWLNTNRASIRSLLEKHPDNGPKVILPEDFSTISIEDWYGYTQRKYNAHWEDQTRLHSDAKGLVPNVLYPWEVLGTLRTSKVNPSPRRDSWESYYSPEFREQMEERYADDLALYEKALSEWDGERPKYF